MVMCLAHEGILVILPLQGLLSKYLISGTKFVKILLNKMKTSSLISLLSLLAFSPVRVSYLFDDSVAGSGSSRLTDGKVKYIPQRQLLYYLAENGDKGENVTVDPSLVFKNPRLRNV
ncbi:hypothetical protein HanRHA438_Chr03g0099851 [Helianthus annuus]|nr:hypothetical protein HanRHA438_Chr03g0099851 [Helianthus annuus]